MGEAVFPHPAEACKVSGRTEREGLGFPNFSLPEGGPITGEKN